MTMTKSIHLLVLIVAQTLAGTKKIPHCSQTTTENTVCSVVDNYDNLSPPTSPTEIIPDIGFRGIHDIDEKKHTVTFLADLGMSWNEPRLSITNSSSDNKGYKIINHLIHSIWVPEMYFPNTIQMKKTDGFKGKYLRSWYLYHVNGTYKVAFMDVIMFTMECKLNFENFPFDSQNCEWAFRTYDLPMSDVILKTPILWQNEGYNYKLISINESAMLNSSGLPYDSKLQASEPTVLTLPDNLNYSLGIMRLQLERKSKEINKLVISYYFPSGAFAVLSAFSFFIKPDVVPGRMGMLVTIFLIVTGIYDSVEAPSSGEFSYIELWYIGIQIPIVFALLEYGIMLAALKYRGTEIEPKHLPEGTTVGGLCKVIDLISFFLSFIFIAIFNCTYIYVCINA